MKSPVISDEEMHKAAWIGCEFREGEDGVECHEQYNVRKVLEAQRDTSDKFKDAEWKDRIGKRDIEWIKALMRAGIMVSKPSDIPERHMTKEEMMILGTSIQGKGVPNER